MWSRGDPGISRGLQASPGRLLTVLSSQSPRAYIASLRVFSLRASPNGRVSRSPVTPKRCPASLGVSYRLLESRGAWSEHLQTTLSGSLPSPSTTVVQRALSPISLANNSSRGSYPFICPGTPSQQAQHPDPPPGQRAPRLKRWVVHSPRRSYRKRH